MEVKKHTKIIAVAVMISAALLPASAALSQDLDEDGADDAMAESASSSISSMVLSGYSVLVTGYVTEHTAARISALGASVTEAYPPALTAGILAQHDVVWISLASAIDVDKAGKSDIVKSYVYGGGGLILEQPNRDMTPKCLPYTFRIASRGYKNPCPGLCC